MADIVVSGVVTGITNATLPSLSTLVDFFGICVLEVSILFLTRSNYDKNKIFKVFKTKIELKYFSIIFN